MGRVRFNFLPKLTHQHTQVFWAIDAMRAPDRREDRTVRQDSAGMRDQKRQQLELFWRESDLDLATVNAVPIEIDRQIASRKLAVQRSLAAERATERGAHAGHELLRPEWLRDVIVGTLIQGCDFVLFRATCGQNQDRRVGPIAYLPADLAPIHIREAEIEDDEIGALSLERVERLAPIAGNGHAVAARAQEWHHRALDRHFVIH